MSLRQRKNDLLLAVVSSVATLLVAEGVLRLAWHPDAENTVIRADPVYGWALRPNASMHSRASDRGLDYHIDIDSFGLRDRDRARQAPPGVRRVLFLGDSIVFGAGVEAAERCTDRLEASLGPDVEIVNAGVSGWGTDQEYLYLLREGFALHPDVVVLGVCMLNDVLNVMLPHELFGSAPKPRFHLAGEALVWEPPAPRAVPPPTRSAKSVLKHSRLLHFAGRHVHLLRARFEHPPPAAGKGPYYDEDLESDASHWAVFRKPLTPRFEAAFRVTEALITAMQESCAAREVPFALFAFPQKVEVDDEARRHELQHYGYDPSWFDLEAPYARLQARADSLAVPFLYPLAAFRRAAAREPLFFVRDGHPDAAGQALAAATLRPLLHDLLQERAVAGRAGRRASQFR